MLPVTSQFDSIRDILQSVSLKLEFHNWCISKRHKFETNVLEFEFECCVELSSVNPLESYRSFYFDYKNRVITISKFDFKLQFETAWIRTKCIRGIQIYMLRWTVNPLHHSVYIHNVYIYISMYRYIIYIYICIDIRYIW